MRIKTRLMMSYISVIVIILAVSLFFAIRGLKRLENRNLEAAREAVEHIVKENITLSQATLTKVAEHFVVLRSRSVALEFQLLLKRDQSLLTDSKGSLDYSALRKNQDARAIFSQKIFTPGSYSRVAGQLDLLDLNGEAVIHPNQKVEGRNYKRWKSKYPEMWALVDTSFTQDQVSGYYSFVDNENKPVRKFMALQRVQGTDFIVVAAVEIDKYFIPIQENIRKVGELIKASTDSDILEASEKTLVEVTTRGVWFFVSLLIFGVLLALWQADSTSRPIRDLSSKVREIGKGDFSVKVLEKGSVEIKDLASSFNSLGQELSEYMENLKLEIEARESIESEIKIARQIQETLLPHSFPPFPDRDEFDLFAALVPAKEMSGDFYDFFFIDKKIIALTIADVSGKGLPAAIFMAVSRTLLRNLCLNGKNQTPAEIFHSANNFLCMENDASMFVTTFLAYINIDTGKVIYANAGHNPFISLKKSDNKVTELGLLSDIPLGVLEDYSFSNGEYSLSEDETVLFYTDGVTEATAPNGDFYGTDRLNALLTSCRADDVKGIVERVKSDVVLYQGDHQFDDITLLAYRQNKKRSRIERG